MRKGRIEIGMQHGRLTVLREVERSRRSIRRYECRCDCGAVAVLRSNHFYPSRKFCTRSCPLLSEQRVVDLTGKTFERWRVISSAGIDEKTGWATWNCVCQCGAEQVIAGAQLAAKLTRSCGCMQRDAKRAGRTDEELLEAKRECARRTARKRAAQVRAAKLKYLNKLSNATPSWLTQYDWAAMNAMYEKARRLTDKTGVRHEVDHIVPINGANVSGFHVPWNLQILTQAKNVAKSNRYADLSGD